MRIQQLPIDIYSKIAAGEVVERPASLVKELIENAIDANATSINISITNGGLAQIIVSDDGDGIEADDLALAIKPHATSKIATSEDLFNINTLGFRGEALASIASVSNLTIKSKHINSEYAYSIRVVDMNIENTEICAHSKGTSIIVNDLFYNTPARLKFLKKPQYEASMIKDVVLSYILSNPYIKFTYKVDNKLVLDHQDLGLVNAMILAFGKEIVSNLYEIDTEYNNITIKGFASYKTVKKANRSFMYFIVNNRLVKNQSLQAAVSQAYHNILMKGEFPVLILNIAMNNDDLDVNVHPQKLEVRFKDSQEIFRAIYHALNKMFTIVETSINTSNNKEDSSNIVDIKEFFSTFDDKYILNQNKSHNLNTQIKFEAAEVNNTLNINFISDNKDKEENNKDSGDNNFAQDNQVLSDVRYLGQFYKTYLAFQNGDALILIDQHAAHERILFDKLKNEIDSNNIYVQELLVPYIKEVDLDAIEVLENNLDKIKSVGIDIEIFGTSAIKVNKVPYIISQVNLDKFLNELIRDANKIFTGALSSIILDRLASIACKAAIKANHILSDYEINSFIKMIKKNQPFLCPHGRPTALILKKEDIDKLFGRL